MVRGKRMICFCLIAGMLAGATGCRNKEDTGLETASLDTEKQAEAKQDTEKQAAATAETTAETQQDTDPLSVENQLRTIAEYAKKWRKMEDKDDPFESMHYAVTDLDRNGRLEIIASSGSQGSGRFTYTDYFQVDQTGDGIKGLKNSSWAGSDIVENISTAYFDPDTEEYHYITSDFASAGLAMGYYTAVTSLTLRKNRIVDEPLGYKDVVVKNGKEKTKYFYTYSEEKKTDHSEKRKLSASEFSSEGISGKAYAKCGKLSVNISWFSFERSLDEMTEEQMIYYLKRSYEAFCLGEPLGLKKKTVNGFSIKIPQYIAMQDKGKQGRLNRMIQDAVEEKFNEARIWGGDKGSKDTDSFALRDFNFTIKYAGEDRVSILAELEGAYPSSSGHSVEQCYGINIDLNEETFLSQTDILPEEYRETVGDWILEDTDTDIKNGKAWRKYKKKKSGQIIEPEEWEDIEVYQTSDSFGVIIQTTLPGKAYAVYEVRQIFVAGESYEDVDWEEYQYRMSPEEYRALQEYMPVLTGGEAFTWTEEKITKRQITTSEREKVTIPQFLEKKRESKENAEDRTCLVELDHVSLCDLTGDGQPELLLSMDEYDIALLLHREGDLYYGLDFNKEKLWFQGLRTDGICIRDPSVGRFYYRVTFENGAFQEEMLGGYEYGSDEEEIYYVKGKKVKEATFDAWYEGIESEVVGEYVPVMKNG